MALATHPLIATVETRFGGVLTKGAHSPDGKACLHAVCDIFVEAAAQSADERPAETVS